MIYFLEIETNRMSSQPRTPTSQPAGRWGMPLTQERAETRPARLAPVDLFADYEPNDPNSHGPGLGPVALQFFMEL